MAAWHRTQFPVEHLNVSPQVATLDQAGQCLQLKRSLYGEALDEVPMVLGNLVFIYCMSEGPSPLDCLGSLAPWQSQLFKGQLPETRNDPLKATSA